MAKAESKHAEKMCALTCCSCNLDLQAIKPVVRDAKYICKACGHVAAKAANLCDPTPLK